MNIRSLLLGLFLITFTSLQSQNNLSVEIDHRMEAISIFYTLATSDTLDEKPTPSIYYKEFKDHFKLYKDHESLNWYRNLEVWDGYDVASLGLFLSEESPYKLKIKPDANYIRSTSIDTFLYHFNQFYKEAKVKKFINGHKKLYKKVSKNAKNSVAKAGILNEAESFYGKKAKGKFIIYLDLLNNIGNNAIPSDNKHFKGNRMFRLAYLEDEDKNLTDDSPVVFVPYLNVVTHEISHLFLQDFIPTYEQELYNIRNHFLTTTDGEQLDDAEWRNELDELMVRVCTAKILEQKFGEERGISEIENQSKHFKWAKPLYDFFGAYTANRKKFKAITDFYPEIMNFLSSKTE